MRRSRLSSCLIVLAAAGVWSQQAPAPVDLDAQSPLVRDPHSTQADLAVPACPAKFNDGLGRNGVETAADESVRPPRVIHTAPAEFSDQARQALKKKHIREFDGTVLINLIVNKNGNPQNLCLRKSLGYGLDANGASAIQQYRFAPATRDGEPTPFRITIEVDYRLY